MLAKQFANPETGSNACPCKLVTCMLMMGNQHSNTKAQNTEKRYNMLLIKVDQCLNGHYVNTVCGDSLQLVQRHDHSFYVLKMNNSLVATFTNTAYLGFQYSMCKVEADSTDDFITVQHWCWNAVEKV